MKVAIVHYWLLSMRGGEKVVDALRELYPEADLFTHVHDPDGVSPRLRQRVRTTFVQRLPLARRLYQWYVPLMPLALEQLDLSGYDLVISSEAGPAKGVITDPGALHVCYCHSPMRYIWDMRHEYLRGAGLLKRILAAVAGHYLRIWDVHSAARVDAFVANSQFVRARIRRYYGRDAAVINPPVDTEFFNGGSSRHEFYLLAGQLVPYKRADIAVEAFRANGRELVVIGEGEARRHLEKLAGRAPNIRFLGWQSDEVLREHLATCRALVFPGLEDFGILPVEAMACGTPVLAYRAGGAAETVLDGETGVLFDAQTPEELNRAITRFETMQDGFDSSGIRERARRFSRARFLERFAALVNELMATRTADHVGGAPSVARAAPAGGAMGRVSV